MLSPNKLFSKRSHSLRGSQQILQVEQDLAIIQISAKFEQRNIVASIQLHHLVSTPLVECIRISLSLHSSRVCNSRLLLGSIQKIGTSHWFSPFAGLLRLRCLRCLLRLLRFLLRFPRDQRHWNHVLPKHRAPAFLRLRLLLLLLLGLLFLLLSLNLLERNHSASPGTSAHSLLSIPSNALFFAASTGSTGSTTWFASIES